MEAKRLKEGNPSKKGPGKKYSIWLALCERALERDWAEANGAPRGARDARGMLICPVEREPQPTPAPPPKRYGDGSNA